MKDQQILYDWLIQTEGALAEIYRLGAGLFSDDKELCGLLTDLSRDELDHQNTLKDAMILMRDTPPLTLCAYVDKKSLDAINGLIASAKEKIAGARMSKNEMLVAVAALEFSETNEIYLFAMKPLNDSLRQFLAITFNIGLHRERIENYINKHPEYAHLIESIKRIPEAGSLNLLIIEDDATMSEAFHIFLSEFGHVDITPNAEEAANMLTCKPYAAIIANLKDSNINAKKFIESASNADPSLKDRFLFLADIDCEQTPFLTSNRLKYLEKPVSLHEIKTNVIEIITNNPLSY